VTHNGSEIGTYLIFHTTNMATKDRRIYSRSY